MNNIEELFKSSLENSEMPFDPKAWESMSARLDQKMPVNPPKSSYTWAWVACAVVITGITAFYFLNDGKESIQQAVNTTQPINQNEKVVPANKVKSISAQPTAENNNNVTNVESKTLTKKQASANQTDNGALTGKSETVKKPVEVEKVNTGKTPETPSETRPFNIVLPKVSANYCESEKISLKNTNDSPIQLATANGNLYTIEGQKALTIELSEVGEYYFIYARNGRTNRQSAFKVNQKPKADFSYDDQMLYDKGLPINNVKSNYTAQEYTWTNSKGEVLSKEKEFDLHLFTKGQHDITLSLEASNGCTNQVTKQVRCESNYNLLAVTGFNPSSSDNRNNTFIPFALLERERNVPFEMVIIDPKDGHTVYQTKDSDRPWDGVDMKTNQMVSPNSTYIWKVTIQNKVVGEPGRTYQGTITRI